MANKIEEPEFQRRLRIELFELTNKMKSLNSFFHGEIPEDFDQTIILMLQMQYQSMSSYRECLRGRMEYMGMFPKEEEE